jgi:hypothetical protein
MEPQDDKELWDVLGRLPKPTVSPIFCSECPKKNSAEAESFRAGAELVQRAKGCWSVGRAAVFVALALVTHYPGPRTTSSNDSDVWLKSIHRIMTSWLIWMH